MTLRGDSALPVWQASMARALTSIAGEWPSELTEAIVPGGTLDAAGALAVYRIGYVARLTEQLGETYRTVWRAVGDESFYALSREYIAAHASASYNLSDYGRSFPEFLAGSREAVAAPFLPDLARLELAFHEVFHAAAHAPITAGELATIGGHGDGLAGVKLEIGGAVRLLACEHAVLELFRHRDDDAEPDVGDTGRRQWLLLYRRRSDVFVEEISCGTYAALDALAHGETVDAALERACASEPSFSAADASKLFETIATHGLACGWSREPHSPGAGDIE